MSGMCDFCGIWHSGSCCHPGRAILREADEQIAELKEQNNELLDKLNTCIIEICDCGSDNSRHSTLCRVTELLGRTI
jgi:hypothetical protein